MANRKTNNISNKYDMARDETTEDMALKSRCSGQYCKSVWRHGPGTAGEVLDLLGSSWDLLEAELEDNPTQGDRHTHGGRNIEIGQRKSPVVVAKGSNLEI
ncbi:unnamed protein product [Bursaphelenchus xylophilus]|nr:unnamed protein product [Bursaphelenchus xylophilus]CAG9110166.1 unnamed protein product [Bursaphelenchus xylophilus]